MAAALRRGPARPGSESAVVPRLPSPARAPPSTCRAECDPPPPAALSLRAAELRVSAGPSRARSWPGRPRAPPGAGCRGPQCRRTRRDCRRDDGSKSRATRPRELAVAQPRLGGCDPESAGGGLGWGFCRELKLRTAVVSEVRRGFFSLSGLFRISEDRPRSHALSCSLALGSVVNYLNAHVGGEGLRLYLDRDATEASHLRKWRFLVLGVFDLCL